MGMYCEYYSGRNYSMTLSWGNDIETWANDIEMWANDIKMRANDIKMPV